ncbi:unnamed protein product [Anisakis simplex]|uniref:Ovule protein n=1 Tax=Anisakis simplex TaxID=6269 RepID=A0A0M3JLW8_ANISI|nr:unnamed protein product [Anisakis simplex]
MTRKRKRPPQNEQELSGKHPNDTHSDNVISHHADTKYDSSFLNSLAGYGQKSGRNSKKYEKSGGVKSKRFNDNRTHQGSRRPLFDEPASEGASSNFKSEFERKYGYVEENGYVGDYGGDYGNYNGQATGEM